jgi:hypothetical protein
MGAALQKSSETLKISYESLKTELKMSLTLELSECVNVYQEQVFFLHFSKEKQTSICWHVSKERRKSWKCKTIKKRKKILFMFTTRICYQFAIAIEVGWKNLKL